MGEKRSRFLDKYKQVFGLFLTKIPSDKMIFDWWLTDSCELQDFIGCNLKEEVSWSTAIGVINAVEKVVQEAIYNGNIK